MSESPSKRSSPATPQKADADFNWPPTDEELAQCFYSAHAGVLAPAAVERGRDETVFTEADVRSDPSTPAPVTNPEDGALDDSAICDIAVAAYEPVSDGASMRDWASQIAHLQALIEALTEKVK